jgi:hypothetical protein
VLFLFNVTEGQVEGCFSPLSWGSFVMAALAAEAFARRTTTTPEPFVSPRLLRNGAIHYLRTPPTRLSSDWNRAIVMGIDTWADMSPSSI